MPLEKVGTFVLTDESLDAHSERVLVKGVKLTRFKSNPVMLYNHLRSVPGFFGDTITTDAVLPIGRWKNITKQDGRIVADAWIDMDDDFAAKIGRKIRSGVLSGVSIGFRALSVSDAEEDKIKGQKGLTITKADLHEASIVDVPANPNATILSKVMQVKDFEGERMDLTDSKVFVKSYSKVKTMQFDFIKWLKGIGKTVPTTEEEAKALFDQEQKTDDTKPDFTEQINGIKSEFEKSLSTLTTQVAALAGKVAELTEAKEAQEAEEEKEVSELEQKMTALAAQINGIKSKRSGKQVPEAEGAAPVDVNGKAADDKDGKGVIQAKVDDILSLIN